MSRPTPLRSGGVLVRADSVIILLLVVTSAMLWFVSACLNVDNRIPDTSHVCTDAELPPPPAGSARHRHTNGRVFYVSVTTQTPISSAGRVRLPGPPLLTRATRATSSSVRQLCHCFRPFRTCFSALRHATPTRAGEKNNTVRFYSWAKQAESHDGAYAKVRATWDEMCRGEA